ncbi:membrane protein DedA with SNARE-associated domain [Luteimonas cucumeris]|uniref:Membrane protein DedA with SNARE-associated domain n=1 Tax=Luteimonas cucumeris TaxID=985012 RepID=A0A562LEW8_9GAMM|nr:bifunctional DedA family/phosphatase PAP2 family protein [Luteimonas cucumeris]TWI06156.1 membrane protein DedA with SNARE-associated domain [Luteimonas cucumeris]
MPTAWLDSLVAWISAHPHAAGLLIAAIAFCDALAVVGIAVPALPLLFAVGALIGLGHIDGSYALACAAIGAFAGDGLSYWIGHRWGPHLSEQWLFRRYPQLLARGERLFRRHGSMGILIARFVGAVRPFVPAIAGMLRMPLKRYLPASLVACVAWAAAFLAPGWIFGASYDAVAAVADKLAIVLFTLLAALALVWAVVLYTYRWFADHANNLLARALKWTHAHPRLGRYAAALIDPNRPESTSLVLLAACLLAIGWAWFAWLAALLARGGPLAIDRSIYDAMSLLRNPLADQLMASLASIGDAQVLVPASVVALAWLLWRKRWMAAAHWLGALVFGLALTALLGAVVDMPRPPTAPSGFGFPSIAVTMTTITLGFFAVLIARELPGRRRVWPYLLSGVVVTLLGFARLYLGAHWLSDIAGGMLFGVAWLLALGIAYRRHVARSFLMRPLAALFYGTFLVAVLWHTPRESERLLAQFVPAPPAHTLAMEDWWRHDWTTLPTRRNEHSSSLAWPLDLQVAGPLQPLRSQLEAAGWRVQSQADWVATLGLLDDDTSPLQQPVLPATLDGHAEALLMLHPGSDGKQQYALRLWQAPARLHDGTPLWIGTTQTLHYVRPFDVAGLWQPQQDPSAAHDELRKALHGSDVREEAHPRTGNRILRVRTGD